VLNQCNFIGRTGKDPEVRYTQGGTAVANFSVACSESWKDKTTGEKMEKTEWVNCTAWGKLAEIIGQYVTKGTLLFVSGKFETQKWDDKDGTTKYKTIINVGTMKMLSSRGDSQGHQSQGNDQQFPEPVMGDDVPF
jgi:single-strand DNA-binding protein